MNTIQVEIVSAEGEIFSGPAKMVFLPAIEGEMGVAPRHAPLLTMLKAGEVRVQPRRARGTAKESDGTRRYGRARQGSR
jgi:F0F1-type ATP synthase epsilon subunit